MRAALRVAGRGGPGQARAHSRVAGLARAAGSGAHTGAAAAVSGLRQGDGADSQCGAQTAVGASRLRDERGKRSWRPSAGTVTGSGRGGACVRARSKKRKASRVNPAGDAAGGDRSGGCTGGCWVLGSARQVVGAISENFPGLARELEAFTGRVQPRIEVTLRCAPVISILWRCSALIAGVSVRILKSKKTGNTGPHHRVATSTEQQLNPTVETQQKARWLVRHIVSVKADASRR
jgi:hypothetical protein